MLQILKFEFCEKYLALVLDHNHYVLFTDRCMVTEKIETVNSSVIEKLVATPMNGVFLVTAKLLGDLEDIDLGWYKGAKSELDMFISAVNSLITPANLVLPKLPP